MGNYKNKRNKRKKTLKREKSYFCSNKFSQELLVAFTVEFEVNILDIDIIDVALNDTPQ